MVLTPWTMEHLVLDLSRSEEASQVSGTEDTGSSGSELLPYVLLPAWAPSVAGTWCTLLRHSDEVTLTLAWGFNLNNHGNGLPSTR